MFYTTHDAHIIVTSVKILTDKFDTLLTTSQRPFTATRITFSQVRPNQRFVQVLLQFEFSWTI